MITIVGAGPIGSYLAQNLALAGQDVIVLEQRTELGQSSACTGLVSKNINRFFVLPRKVITNRIYGAQIISPAGNKLDILTHKQQAYVINRELFDIWLAKRAKKAGAHFLLNTTFKSIKQTNKRLQIITNHGFVVTDFLVGADGPLSAVAKSANLFGNRKFWMGIQITAELKNAPVRQVQVYLNRKFSMDLFAWVVPVGGALYRIGIASSKNAHIYFSNFLKFLESKHKHKISPIKKEAGLIPKYNPFQRVCKGNVFLVGDAATQVKATTGGGLIFGFTAATALQKTILKHRIYTNLNKELIMHSILRFYLNHQSNKSLNKLIHKLNKPTIKSYLEAKGDLDFLSKFLLSCKLLR